MLLLNIIHLNKKMRDRKLNAEKQRLTSKLLNRDSQHNLMMAMTEISVNKKIKVVISGGGTGGHVFPAIAIANSLKANYPNIDILMEYC